MSIVYDRNGYPVLEDDIDYEAEAEARAEDADQPRTIETGRKIRDHLGVRYVRDIRADDHDAFLSMDHPDKAAADMVAEKERREREAAGSTSDTTWTR